MLNDKTLHDMNFFCNFYLGKTGTIVGSGPTRFNYENISNLESPIIFVNDSVIMSKYSKEPCHLYTVHEDIIFERHKNKLPEYVWSKIVKPPSVIPFAITYRRTYIDKIFFQSLNDRSLIQDIICNRQEMKKKNLLYTFGLSATGAVCLAYYFGCDALRFIGCHNKGKNHHDPRINNNPFYGHGAINFLKSVTNAFGYNFSELE